MPTTKLAVMLGAGNVGWGFLGPLFSESGYKVVKGVNQIRPEETPGVSALAGYRRLWVG
jgi:hypothetical protein